MTKLCLVKDSLKKLELINVCDDIASYARAFIT